MALFADVSEEDIDFLISEKDAKHTKKATEQSWRVLTSYCEEKSITLNIETVSKIGLNNLLKQFYIEARKSNGEFFQKKHFRMYPAWN